MSDFTCLASDLATAVQALIRRTDNLKGDWNDEQRQRLIEAHVLPCIASARAYILVLESLGKEAERLLHEALD